MKLIALLVLALGLVFSGCATTDSGSKPQAVQKQPERNPEVGMTREQVVQLYGKTDSIHATNEGETWIYRLNMGEAFIPFNFGYRPKVRIINFGPDGLVRTWSYTK